MIISFIRSAIFKASLFVILFPLSFIGFCMSPFNDKYVLRLPKIASSLVIKSAKLFCGLKYQIIGDLPTQQDTNHPFIIASKHESMYECFLLAALIPNACFVIKKEMLDIPLFGTVMKTCRNISIDRSAGSRMIPVINAGMRQVVLKEGRIGIIFPEGTRMENGKPSECKQGIALLYKENFADILPVWVDAGKYWNTKNFIVSPGTVQVRILHRIEKETINYKTIVNMLNKEFDSCISLSEEN